MPPTIDRSTLRGVWVAMPTPWNGNGAVDAGAVRELVSRYRAAGLHGAYTTGTDGEMHVLDLPEFRDLVDAFAAAAEATGSPVQVGCTWSHTEGVIERVRYAADRGIDTVQIALPSWVPLNEREVLTFFAQITVAAPQTKIVHYNIARTGRFLTGKDYRALLDVAPNLIGSKHTGGDAGSILEITRSTPELAHFVVDGQIVPGALFGAKGFYSFIANLSPAFALDLWHACEAGEWARAADLRAVSDAFFREWLTSIPEITASPALGKIATAAGIYPEMSLAVRSPYQSGTTEQVQALRSLIATRYSSFGTETQP